MGGKEQGDMLAFFSLLLVLSAAGAAVGAGTGSAFPESHLVTPAQGAQLNSWAGPFAVNTTWELCYSSYTMDQTPAEFHKRCDQYQLTMTIAHTSFDGKQGTCSGTCCDPDEGNCRECSDIGSNCTTETGNQATCAGQCSRDPRACSGPQGSSCGYKGNFTFGGFADGTWSGNTYKGTDACFLFRLGPGEPKRFGPKPGGEHWLGYQECRPHYYPRWGSFGDLSIGSDGPPGADGFCGQGMTFTSGEGEICGGTHWGETHLEVWRKA